ncbi:MAG: hypothetical protein AAFV69_01945 [Pseudomonadota bacterium]
MSFIEFLYDLMLESSSSRTDKAAGGTAAVVVPTNGTSAISVFWPPLNTGWSALVRSVGRAPIYLPSKALSGNTDSGPFTDHATTALAVG